MPVLPISNYIYRLTCGYKIKPSIIEAITNYPTSLSQSDIRSFIGLVNQLSTSTTRRARAKYCSTSNGPHRSCYKTTWTAKWSTKKKRDNLRRQQVCEGRLASLRALNYQADNFVNTTSVGLLNVECQNCSALKFCKETGGLCCSKGNIKFGCKMHSTTTAILAASA